MSLESRSHSCSFITFNNYCLKYKGLPLPENCQISSCRKATLTFQPYSTRHSSPAHNPNKRGISTKIGYIYLTL